MAKISQYIYPDKLEENNSSYVEKPEIFLKSGGSTEEKEIKTKNKWKE